MSAYIRIPSEPTFIIVLDDEDDSEYNVPRWGNGVECDNTTCASCGDKCGPYTTTQPSRQLDIYGHAIMEPVIEWIPVYHRTLTYIDNERPLLCQQCVEKEWWKYHENLHLVADHLHDTRADHRHAGEAVELQRRVVGSVRHRARRVLRRATEPKVDRMSNEDEVRLAMVGQLHVAVYGDTWARPESPAVVWDRLLKAVEQMRNGPWVVYRWDSDADENRGGRWEHGVPVEPTPWTIDQFQAWARPSKTNPYKSGEPCRAWPWLDHYYVEAMEYDG